MTKKIKRKNAKKSNELINPETGLVRIYVDDCEIYNTLIKLRGISRSSFSIGNVVVHISPGSWIDPLARNKDVIFHIRHSEMGEEKGFFLLVTCTKSMKIGGFAVCVERTQIQVACMYHHLDKIDDILTCIFEDLGISIDYPIIIESTLETDEHHINPSHHA